MKVYIGHDKREEAAFTVAASTLLQTSNIVAEPLVEERLRAAGLLWRPVDRRGRMHDLISGADQSTEFALSRFLVPMLCQTGWALFTDCDVVFMRDLAELSLSIGPITRGKKAVYVVKHDHQPRELWKMDGQTQKVYPRKNWSSVVMWNCDHPANRRLSLHDVNTRHRNDLHAFYWLHDSEIGELAPEWNWLVGVQPKPIAPAIAHYTLGGPFTPGWHGAEHDELWLEAAKA